MFLFINTSNVDEIFLASVNQRGDFLVKKKVKAEYKQSEKLLVNIDKLINPEGKKPFSRRGGKSQLNGIIVVKGPGSFTSLRIGVATANALGYGLGIPVVGVKKNENEEIGRLVSKGLKGLKGRKGRWVVPEYGKEPNITIKKQ